MFTGIVAIMGTVACIKDIDTSEAGGNGWSITITDANPILQDVHVGDSISINGTCLTVTQFDDQRNSFMVGVSPESLRRTNLGQLREGDKVNLEPAMMLHTRVGGHFVQGHVDTVATIYDIQPEGNSVWYTLQLSQEESACMRYLIPKGYVALDGTSLTVCNVNDSERTFSIMMIAHTLTKVVMPSKKKGDLVNIEFDMLGKYVEKMIMAEGTSSIQQYQQKFTQK